jgi:hypothetical protein
LIIFKVLDEIAGVQRKARRSLVSRRIYRFLTKYTAGNNSGALLLTMERFTIMARPLLAMIC